MNKAIRPPKFATQFLRWFCAEELIEEVQGDLEEAYRFRRNKYGKLRADLWFISDVLKFFKPYAFEKHSRSKQFLPMFNNYVKVSVRNIGKRRGFAAINTIGLSIGTTAVMLVGLYIHHEANYDQSFPDSENIYRLVNKYRDQTYTCMKFSDYYGSGYETQLELTNHLKRYDGVEEACHFVPNLSAIGPASKWYIFADGREFVRDDFLFTNTGSAFQVIFPQDFLIGSPESAFSMFETVVLTESVAQLLYGEDWRYKNLLTKSIRIQDETFQVAGVVADLPGNIHFDFGILVHQKEIPSWAGYTYFKTIPGTSGEEILAKINADVELFYPGYTEDVLSKGIELVALQDIHFIDGMLYEIKTTANVQYLKIFAIVGCVILLIIWTNYANLSIATYAGRQKELGIRKVMGALSKDISLQVVVEALLLSILCFPFVLLLIYLLLPSMNELLGVDIAKAIILQPVTLLIFLGILVFTGLVSGVYPAIVFGSKSMIKLMEGKLNATKSGRFFSFRRVLLIGQFFMVVALMSLASTIGKQIQYIQEKPAGFVREGVVFFNVAGAEKFKAMQQLIESMPEVKAIGSGMVPGAEMYNQLTYKMRGTDEVFSDGTQLYTSLGSLKVLEIHSDALTQLSNQDSVFLINETAARKLAAVKGVEPNKLIGDVLITEPEWENEEFGNGIPHTIAGIIADFDYFSLKYESQSLLMEVHTSPGWVYNMLVRAETDNWVETISKIEEHYLAVEEKRPFELTFLDSYMEELYDKEVSAVKLASGLTLISVILSIMGLVGVVGFVTLTRKKEIGVRKVFGASTQSILGLIVKEYATMLVLATMLAVPASMYLGNQWLMDFAYRIAPSFWTVVLFGGITFAIVAFVVVAQSFKSANMNPSDTLRYE